MALIEGCLYLHPGVVRNGITAGRYASGVGNPG
jgi:hypothetical protein